MSTFFQHLLYLLRVITQPAINCCAIIDDINKYNLLRNVVKNSRKVRPDIGYFSMRYVISSDETAIARYIIWLNFSPPSALIKALKIATDIVNYSSARVYARSSASSHN